MFLLMMTLHPEVARRAQSDIDHVVGDERLPGFEDRGQLPYIDCILKEVLRLVMHSLLEQHVNFKSGYIRRRRSVSLTIS